MSVETMNIVVNAVCNLIIFISMLAFIIFCFGRRNSAIYKYGSFQAYGLKFGLVTVCLGSLSNLLTFSNPPFTEIILNIGLAALFLWAAVFHYLVFILKKEPQKPMSKAQIQKGNEEISVGSTWLVSLIAQIVNTALIGYLITLLFTSNFINGSVMTITSVFFIAIQFWSFYSIFKTLRIRMASSKNKALKKARGKQRSK